MDKLYHKYHAHKERGDSGQKIPTINQCTKGKLGDGSIHISICFPSTLRKGIAIPCPVEVRIDHMTTFANEMC